MAHLQSQGYGKPFICVLDSQRYADALTPAGDALTVPADRLEPTLGHKLVLSSALQPNKGERAGVLLSLAGDAVDLVMATEAVPEFTFVNEKGRLVFRVVERFALRIKDQAAIVVLTFKE